MDARKALEEQVVQLKQTYGKQLKIHKSDGSAAPFPLQLTFSVEPPAAALARYDLDAAQVTVTLQDSVLQLLTQLQHATQNSIIAAVLNHAQALAIKTTSPQVVGELEQRQLSEKLLAAWRKRVVNQAALPRSLVLDAAARELQDQFVPLLTSVCELEGYEALDEQGRTVRRFAVLSRGAAVPADAKQQQQQLQDVVASSAGKAAEDASISHHSPTASTVHAQAPAGPVDDEQPQPQQQPRQLQKQQQQIKVVRRKDTHTADAVSSAAQPAASMQPAAVGTAATAAPLSITDLCRDLQYFNRRYPRQLRVEHPQLQLCMQQLVMSPLQQQQQQLQQHLTQSLQPGAGAGISKQAVPNLTGIPAASQLSAAAAPFVPGGATGGAFSTTPQQQQPASRPHAVATLQQGPKQRQLQQQWQAPSQKLSVQQPAHQPQVLFVLELQPTDPTWERGPVLLQGMGQWQEPASQQQQQQQQQQQGAEVHAFSLQVSDSCPLPSWLRQGMSTHLTQQVLPGRGGLREAVRQVENYASQLEAAAELQARASGTRTALGQPGAQAAGGSCSTSASRLQGVTDTMRYSPGAGSRGSHSGAYSADGGGNSSDGGLYDGDDDGRGVPGSSGGGSDDSNCSGMNDFGEPDAAADSDAAEGSNSEEEEEEDEGDEEVEEEERDEVKFSGVAAAGAAEGDAAGRSTAPDAWALVLEGLQLDELSAAEALRTVLQVCCSRCGATGSVSIASEAVASGPSSSKAGGSSHHLTASQACPGCHAGWTVQLRPKFVHASSNVLCVVKAAGCTPRDLLPSLFAAQCEHCSAVMSLRDVQGGDASGHAHRHTGTHAQVGLSKARTCSSCQHHLSLTIPAVSFVPRGPPAGATTGQGKRGGAPTSRAQAASRAALAKNRQQGVLAVGQPLPNNGACKHYQHSYRWLRFPCCGMRFPCDVCHEEEVPDGHEARWATKMVCGFCSVEQPVSSQCAACHKKLTTSGANPSGRLTRFWEGGQGCRDKSRMHRNDPHKYRNTAAKTKSAKHTRVGPKAWSKELKQDS